MTALTLHTGTALSTVPADAFDEAEAAANNGFTDEGTKTADSLQARAAKAALNALAKRDSWDRRAALSTALVLCAEQIRETLTGQEYSAEKDAFVFRKVILFPAAVAGAQIFDGTADEVAAIRATDPRSDERKALAAAYCKRKMTKETGFSHGFKVQRTVAFRLAAWARLNLKNELISIARLSMGSLDAAESRWNTVITEKFGPTFDRLAEQLAQWNKDRAPSKADKAPKASKGESVKPAVDAAEAAAQAAAHSRRDPVAAILAQVETLDAGQFASLMMRLKAMEADAAADAAPVIALPAPSQASNLPARRAA